MDFRKARATLALSVFLLAAFLGQVLSGGALTRWAARDSYFFLRPEPHRLLTANFVHGNWIHIACSLLTLITIGGILEPLIGPWLFLAVFLLAGLEGNLLSAKYFPEAASVGASGGLYGLAGVVFVLMLRRVGPFQQPWAAWTANLLFLSMMLGIFLMPGLGPIDRWAHLGGLITGLTAGAFLQTKSGEPYRLHPLGWVALAALVGWSYLTL